MNDRSPQDELTSYATIKIDRDLTIENVASLKTLLVASIKESDAFVIDAGGVTSVDVAGLQLLCSAHRTALLMDRKAVLADDRPRVFRQAVLESGYARSEGCTARGRGDCIWIGGETDG